MSLNSSECVQLCQMCAENEDIVLLKVDWDQNKPVARPLGVKVISTFHRLLLHTCHDMEMRIIHAKEGEYTWFAECC